MRSNVNVTVDERDTDMGGGAVFHDNRVNIEPSSNCTRQPTVSGSRQCSPSTPT